MYIILKTVNFTKIFVLTCCLFMFAKLSAQDMHFSQFHNSYLDLSPALTGQFDGDMRFMGNYRAQWYNVPVNYRTFTGAFDTKFKFNPNRRKLRYLSGGVLFHWDRAGDSDLTTLQLGLFGSYTHQVSKASFLSAGLQIGGYQRSFDTDNLTWDFQYFNGGEPRIPAVAVNPGAVSGENFTDDNIFYGDISVGLNWNYQSPKSRTNIHIGGGLFHFNEPTKTFYDDSEVKLPKKWSIHGLATLELIDNFDLILMGVGRYQNAYTEHVLGVAGLLHLEQDDTKELAIQLGLDYRFNAEGFGTGDAIIPAAEVHYKAWRVGLSWDINISDFNVATNNNGGPEIAVIYILRKPPAEEFCETCPIYQ